LKDAAPADPRRCIHQTIVVAAPTTAPTETMNHISINPSDARDVLDYHNPDGDFEGGDFKRNLITAIICAGPEDRARLALGFPSLVAAIRSQTFNPAGIEYLEGIARSYERPSGQGR